LGQFFADIQDNFDFSCMQERYKKQIGMILQCWLCTFFKKNPMIYVLDFTQDVVWEKMYADLNDSLLTLFKGDKSEYEEKPVFKKESLVDEILIDSSEDEIIEKLF
jgi:hypothetical protein